MQYMHDPIEPSHEFWPGISKHELASPNQEVLDSPAPWSSISNGACTIESSPSSAMSWPSTDSPMTPGVGTQPVPLTNLSQGPPAPPSLAPSTPATSVTSCKSCSLVFAGSPQDARSNLQRHLRTSQRHNKNEGLRCPHPECRTRPPMRSDNLGPHLKKKHRMSPLEIQHAVQESRLSARKGKSDETTRRRVSSGIGA